MASSRMDPPLVNKSSFSAANPSAYTLADIGHLNGEADAGELDPGIGKLGHELTGFADAAANGDGSLEESTVNEQSAGQGRARSNVARSKRKDVSFEDVSSKIVSTSSTANDLFDSNSKRIKLPRSKENDGLKADMEPSSAADNNSTEQLTKPPEPPKQDYVHVRARRGQATDSHSLAERARREKISERMRILQDLVPGCNKVIGKALVLDEIINYIQSLQRQVEFLSLKLEAVNSRMHISHVIEGFPSKDASLPIALLDFEVVRNDCSDIVYQMSQHAAPSFDASALIFAPQASRGHVKGPQPDWLHIQLGGSFERAT